MSALRVLCAVAVAVALVCGNASAQQPPPKPTTELAPLKKLEGNWDTTFTMAGQDSKGFATFKMDLGGLWLASTFESSMMGEKFWGRGFDSFDVGKQKYVSMWLDSMSTTPMMMEGTYDKAKKTMTLKGEGPGEGGKMMKYWSTSEMPDDNTIKFAMYMGDSKEPAFTIVYKRKK